MNQSLPKTVARIAIFASGNGSNAQKIIDLSRRERWGNVVLILTDNLKSFISQRADKEQIKLIYLPRNKLNNGQYINQVLHENGVDLVVLAGYLKLIPPETVRTFNRKMVNIHPALLPAYGGKGMYGMNVHQAVIKNREKFSGITIHFVNEVYDKGQQILQVSLQIAPHWDAHQLAQEIHKLEHQYYPEEIKKLCLHINNQ